MPKLLGIEQLKKALNLALELINSIDKSGRARGVMGKTMPFMALADELADLEGVSWAQVTAELKDLDGEEREQIKALIKAKLDLVDDDLESAIEDLIAFINEGYNLTVRAKALIAKRKK